MKYFIIGLLSLFYFFSCNEQKEINDIIASFPPNYVDYNIPPECQENNGYYNKDSEIVLINEDEFNSIINRLEKLKSSEEINDCPSDFSFSVGKDKYCSCLYEERLVLKNGQLHEIPDTLLYDIKSALTFYNSRTKEYLKYDPLIKKFGFPKNYKFQRAGETLISYDQDGNKTVSFLDFKMRLVTLKTK